MKAQTMIRSTSSDSHRYSASRLPTGSLSRFCLAGLLLPGPALALTLGEVPGQSTLQSNTGNGVQTVCGRLLGATRSLTTIESQLLTACGSMVHNARVLTGDSGPTGLSLGLTASELNAVLQNTAGEEIAAPGSLATETSNGQINGAMFRLDALQGGGGGFSVGYLDAQSQQPLELAAQGRNASFGLPRGGGAGDHLDDEDGMLEGPWGGFVNFSGSFGEKDATSQEDGFEFDAQGVTAGADYRFNDHWVLGGAFSYNQSDVDFDTTSTVAGGGIEADYFGVSVYALYEQDELYLNGVLGYGRGNHDISRRILVPSNNMSVAAIDTTATASPDSDNYLLSIGGGYDFVNGATTYGPVFRLNYVHVELDGYTETGAGALNLQVQDQTIKSLTSALGARISHAISRDYGVLVPQASIVWRHEYKGDSRTISTSYVNEFIPAGESATVLPVVTESPDEDYGIVTVGISAVYQSGLQGFLAYERWVGLSDIEENLLTIGVRMPF